MSVLIFSESLRRIGGAEIYVDRQAGALRDLGHDVIAICGQDDASRTDSPFVARYEIPALFSAAFRSSSLRDAWRSTRALEPILERHRPEAALLHIFDAPIGLRSVQRMLPTLRFVHTPWTFCPAGTRWLRRSNRQCHSPPGLSCLAVNRSEGCLVSSQGVPFNTKQSLRRIADMSLQREYFRNSTLVCANTSYSAGEVIRLSGRSDNVVVLPPPVPRSVATIGEPIAGRVLFAGRITHDKGLADVVRAIARLRDVHLVIAGDGPERERVAILVAELGLAARVEFLGWVDQTRLDEAMQLSTVVVLPSLWGETFGLVGVQASMNRRPVVGYASGGIPDWLTPEVGILVPPGDITKLTEGIDRLVSDHELAAHLGSTGFSLAQMFLPERHAQQLTGLIFESRRRWQAR
jgi:glycosyltransferase involved in cell wall biosynthesis